MSGAPAAKALAVGDIVVTLRDVPIDGVPIKRGVDVTVADVGGADPKKPALDIGAARLWLRYGWARVKPTTAKPAKD